MKILHIYFGIYYAWGKTPVPPNEWSVTQSFVRVLNFINQEWVLKKKYPPPQNQKIFLI